MRSNSGTRGRARPIAALPFNEAAFAKEVGVPAFAGEAGYSMLERLWPVRPARSTGS